MLLSVSVDKGERRRSFAAVGVRLISPDLSSPSVSSATSTAVLSFSSLVLSSLSSNGKFVMLMEDCYGRKNKVYF